MRLLLLLIFFAAFKNINAQSIPVGSIDLNLAEQRGRNEQLLGKTDSLVSFTLRPLAIGLIDTSTTSSLLHSKHFTLKTLPVTILQQYNTLAPSGWNDGNMIPARGYQTLLSAGLYAKYRFLSVQLRPEYVFAQNSSYELFPDQTDTIYTAEIRKAYIHYLNYADLPAPFGENHYSRLNWGQSNIKVNFHSFSIGASTENLWWGPGVRNSLLMSNNAAGFLHFTLNTNKPAKTFLGSFELQMISGKLENSGYRNPKSQFIVDGVDYEITKRDEWRYINGISINYHPKWVPGLFLGFNRVVQLYNGDLGSGFIDYFPVFLPFQKKSVGGNEGEDKKNRDQLASLFFRWVMKESKFEFYGEYGKNDYPVDYMDMYMSPEHSRAYIAGFSKIFMINKIKNKYLKLNMEVTYLNQASDRITRPAGVWYEHGVIQHGYTNRGEVLGAGIGLGSNLQTMDFSVWGKDFSYGVQFERYAHNMDFYYDVFPMYSFYSKWVDLSLNTYMYKKLGDFALQGKINTSYMPSYQYHNAWITIPKYNFQLQFTAQYNF